MRKIFLSTVFCLLFVCGCATGISVTPTDRLGNTSKPEIMGGTKLLAQTENLLADHLLVETFESNPEKALHRMQNIFRTEPRPHYLFAMADISLKAGHRFKSDRDQAIRFYLPAAIFSYAYLAALDNPGEFPYNADRVQVIKIYNTAVNEIFDYLHFRKLYRKDGFSFATAGNQRVTFAPPEYNLAMPPENFDDFKLCADYETENLSHNSRHFGIGAPLICDLKNDFYQDSQWVKDQVFPATLTIAFNTDGRLTELKAKLIFHNTRDTNTVNVAGREIPLAMDFSTPIAYMAKRPLPLHHMVYAFYPELGAEMQGLYKFEPFNDQRIPVVLVHGLLSNTRTWIQMLNTLQNDPDIRKHYQFWGFSYSSGVPILFSARELRRALLNERTKLIRQGYSVKMFDRMVLVGHSMGGLLSKTAIMDSGSDLGSNIITSQVKDARLDHLDQEQKDFLASVFSFEHLAFVRRVIFIAVPHRGSDFAKNFVGRLGSKLVRLPITMISTLNGIVTNLIADKKVSDYPTGIDNLMPESAVLKELAKIPFVKDVPYHSIIGNADGDGVPAGSDGIVPYSSSHLDGAKSELVVHSGHSAQQNPLTILEVRRILLEHLKSYPDIKLAVPQSLREHQTSFD